MRAIAVVAVMAFHAEFAVASGGYSGVDIFYVISGFLITGILLREQTQAQGWWAQIALFYERRVRRILPALFVVLAACLPPAFLLLLPDALEAFGRSLAASSVFGANFFFWRETSGYFNEPVRLMPLLHLWSLAVEEQFYLFYPPLLLLLLGRMRRFLVPVLLSVAAASLALSELLSVFRPGANFFLLPTRGWELAAGAVLALWRPSGEGGLASRRWDGLAALVGLVLVVAPVFILDSASRFPGLAAVPTVAGTMLLIAFATPANAVGSLLASRIFVGAGLLSYSAYLWHQPLLAFAREIDFDGELAVGESLAVLLAAFLLAYVSWRWVETAFRRRSFLSRRTIFLLAGGGVATFLAIGFAIAASKGLPQRLPPHLAGLLELRGQFERQIEPCLQGADHELPLERACIRGRSGPVSVALVGDSHAAGMGPAFDGLLERRGARMILLTGGGCPPVLSNVILATYQQHCRGFHRRTFDYLIAHPEVRTVILAARWTLYIERDGLDNRQGGVERWPLFPVTEEQRQATAASYREMALRLLAAGKQVVLVYPIPEAGWRVPVQMVRLALIGVDRELTTSHDLFVARNRLAYEAFDAIGQHPNLVRLYPARGLCNTLRPGRCVLHDGPVPLYFDSSHLTPPGVRLALPRAEAVIPDRISSGEIRQPTP